MNLRLVLAWLLAAPMFLFLLFYTFCFLASLLLLAFYGTDAQHLFLVAGSSIYLFLAHALFFGSYFAFPALYEGRLNFLEAVFFHTKPALVLAFIYAISIGYTLHHFGIV